MTIRTKTDTAGAQRWRSWQALTGLLVAGFLVLHLLNTWLGALGPAAYDGLQRGLRVIYQWPPLEFLVLTAILVHALIGMRSLWQRRRQRRSQGTILSRPAAAAVLVPAHLRWHRRAGLFLLIVIGGHLFAVRGVNWLFDVRLGFDGLAFSMDFAPYYFWPYYLLLGFGGFYHGLNGARLALARLAPDRGLGRWPLRGLSVAGALLTFAALGAFAGLWFDVGDPAQGEFGQWARRMLNAPW